MPRPRSVYSSSVDWAPSPGVEETGVAAGSAFGEEGWISVTGTRMLRGKKGIVDVPVGTSS